MMKRIAKKYLKITGIVLGSVVGLVVILTVVANFMFKDQLIRVVIDQLNKQVDAKISIAKVDLSIWRSFPNVSVRFDGVYAQSSNKFRASDKLENPDTLLTASEVFFEFNVIKLLRSQYELKKVYIKDGYIKLKIDKVGNLNYDIIKPSGEKSDNQFNLELKDLVFSNSKIEYINNPGNVKIFGLADKFQIKGDFNSKSTKLDINTKLFLNYLVVDNYTYISNKKIQFQVNFVIKDSRYQIESDLLEIEKVDLTASGDFLLGIHPSINLAVKVKNVNMDQLLEILPSNVQDVCKGYSFRGKANIGIAIKGPMGKSQSPAFNLTYNVVNGSVVHKASGIKLKNLNLTGSYVYRTADSARFSLAKFERVSLNLGSGKISGSGSIEDKGKPFVKIDALYSLDLNELKQFFNLDTLEVLTGNVEGNLLASGEIMTTKSSFKFNDINNLECKGQIHLKDAAVKIKENDYFLNRINGNVDVDKNLNFNNITLYLHENDFLINGQLLDWANYLSDNQKDVTLKADVTSRNLDLSKYFETDTKKTNSTYSRELLFPDHLNLEVKLNINKFKLNKFNAKWASGYLSYKPKMFVLKSLTFESMEGKVTGNGAIIQDFSKNFIVRGQVDVSKVDIKQMFTTFNNFSQTILLDKHLHGRVSGRIGISSEWNNALYLNKDKLLVDADITIENGELSNFEPLYSLSRFVALEELKDIRFSTLKNHIYIKDKQIVIPQMDVHSSAMDISASGEHLFDNHYSYKIKVLLSDVLWGKAKRAKKENEEFGAVEDDGLGKTTIPISIVGFNNEYKITYDSKKTIESVKQSFKDQKKEMRSLLNEEFGWFRKDSTLKKDKVEKKTSRVRVQWDDTDEETTAKPVKDNKSKKNKTQDSENAKIEWDN
jgi:hypothetical protein